MTRAVQWAVFGAVPTPGDAPGVGVRPFRVAGADIARDFVDADDAADGFVALATADHAPERLYNVGAPHATPLAEVLDHLVECLPGFVWEAVQEHELPDLVQRREQSRAAMNVDRMARDTGWTPRTSVADGVAALVAHHVAAREGRTPERSS